MKELSIEEKAKRYDEALGHVGGCTPDVNGFITIYPQEIFPELKESEDEEIRKALISKYQGNGCLCNSKYKLSYKKIVDWLENQGEIDKVSYEIAEKEKREFVGDGFIKCYADFQDFKEEELYWLEYVGNDNYNVRSDNLLGKTYHITPCQLYTIFKKMTWLEKQEEPNPYSGVSFKYNGHTWGMCARDNGVDILCDKHIIGHLEKQCEQKPYGQRQECVDCQFNYAGECKGSCTMKRGEQKPSDKVEPKFKVRDWCIDNEDGTIFQIVKVLNNTYTYRTNEGKEYSGTTHYSLENDARLWTINDAKDGDVLATDAGGVFIYAKVLYNMPYAYCGVDKFGVFKDNCLNNNWTNSVDCVHPATKEQRETLMKAMTDARYTFDFDKKELNRIMDEKQIKKNLQDNSFRRMFEQKPAWSEEDKVMLDEIIDFFENGTVKLQHDLSLYASWLKSLRPQNTWKPSDEQMEALEHFIVYHNGSTNYAKDLEELRLQLKKL